MNDLTTVVDWSRWQFALTAIYHWLFVPLTLGLSVLVAIMESLYLKTKSEKWLLATKFWMRLFGIMPWKHWRAPFPNGDALL